LRRAEVLASLRRLSTLALHGVPILIVVVRLAVEFLLEAGDPLVDCLLCLLEALFDVLADLGKVVYMY
jgi:hypothetical protein